MHPMLKPAMRRAWRERQIIQFGVTPAHAVSVGPVDTATGALLERLDGTRGLPLLRDEARAMGLPDGHVDALVTRLTAAGLLDDTRADGSAPPVLRERSGTLDRLRPDLAALSLVHPEPGGGAHRLAARHATHVQVRGAGRVGAMVAALLASAGVGRVDVLDGGRVEPWDVCPGGLPETSVGERRDTAARQLVRASAPLPPPRARGGAAGDHSEPRLSLVLVCPRDGLAAYAPDPVLATDWIAAGIPHLYAGVIEATGVVGPLVLPGGTACAGCVERRQAEREPGWTRLLAQWRSGGRQRPVPACDIALAAIVAGTAAAHALAFLDGELPASVASRAEISPPRLDWRSRPLVPHRDCPCGAPTKSEGEHTSGSGPAHETMTEGPPSTESGP
ncbi:TOMM precursor leader peptide-binding protein [Streptomyces sp. NPDC057638]|uniref:TOMM precursor leader peptide-binding protein n=1 Tax=Streptomyces sp. NPDC057638 TaxID=3346190 RepID=UPI0036873040